MSARAKHTPLERVRVSERMNPFYLPYRVVTGGGEHRGFEQ